MGRATCGHPLLIAPITVKLNRLGKLFPDTDVHVDALCAIARVRRANVRESNIGTSDRRS